MNFFHAPLVDTLCNYKLWNQGLLVLSGAKVFESYKLEPSDLSHWDTLHSVKRCCLFHAYCSGFGVIINGTKWPIKEKTHNLKCFFISFFPSEGKHHDTQCDNAAKQHNSAKSATLEHSGRWKEHSCPKKSQCQPLSKLHHTWCRETRGVLQTQLVLRLIGLCHLLRIRQYLLSGSAHRGARCWQVYLGQHIRWCAR